MGEESRCVGGVKSLEFSRSLTIFRLDVTVAEENEENNDNADGKLNCNDYERTDAHKKDLQENVQVERDRVVDARHVTCEARENCSQRIYHEELYSLVQDNTFRQSNKDCLRCDNVSIGETK